MKFEDHVAGVVADCAGGVGGAVVKKLVARAFGGLSGSGLGGDRIPSTTPGAEPPRGAKDSGSARSHSTHLETSSQKRP